MDDIWLKIYDSGIERVKSVLLESRRHYRNLCFIKGSATAESLTGLGATGNGHDFYQHLFFQAMFRYAITICGVKSVGIFADSS